MIVLLAGAIVASVASVVYFRYRKLFHIISKTYRRDIQGATAFIKLNISLWWWSKMNKTVPELFSSIVKKHPEKVAFRFEDDSWTFKQADLFSNKVARYFRSMGYKKGDCIALLLENRPEYVLLWLGLSKIGVITSLINTNLSNQPLVHSLKICKAKSLIFGSVYLENVKTVLKDLPPDFMFFQYFETPNNNASLLVPTCKNLRQDLVAISDAAIENFEMLSAKDPLMYIYTSGTTGLPKAAIITNLRYSFMAKGVYVMTLLKPDDILYGSLPLYHSSGGITGAGQPLLSGITFVIRKKFSASNYFKDCAKYNCTVAQYVGELCRYILIASQNTPPVKHSVKSMYGNGLKGQIWTEFVNKFNIKNIYEFYGSTEGVSSMINIDNRVGAIGFIPILFRRVHPMTLIRCDETTGEPIRNKEGFCMKCDTYEAGLIIAPVNPKSAVLNFKGYCDEEATDKKILRNVFKKGDRYFNSGDVLMEDEYGYFYFKDRLGDTFRWKGENVSTNEVEAVISNVINLSDATVYGVEISGAEGRAGMAAIVDENENLDIERLYTGLKNNLASYAIPLFIRVLKTMPITGTFKLKKTDLQSDGFNINKINDSMYFLDTKAKKYVPLTRELYEQIINGKINL